MNQATLNKRGRTWNDQPLLPLKNVVLFPHCVITLMVGRDKSIAAVHEAMERSQKLVVAAQRDAEQEDPGTDDIHRIGTLAEIVQFQKQPGGSLQVVLEGLQRVSVDRFVSEQPFFRIKATDLPEIIPESTQVSPLVQQVQGMFERYAKTSRTQAPDAVESVAKLTDPGRLADTLASHLPLELSTRQGLLEMLDESQRLERISALLNNALELLDLDEKIRLRVRQQMDRNQREYYLKEQLKAIHEELGNTQPGEIAELRARLAAKGMPQEIEARIGREIDRLERIPQSSPEGNVIRTFLDTVLALPWTERSDDQLDIDQAQKILDQDHYGLEKVKERIIDFLAVRQLISQGDQARRIKGPILCFIGPPGVGKTSLGRSIARAMGRKFVRLSLGGVRDEAEIRGHRRTYVGALPGRIIQAMRTAGTRNPVIMLDEIDKMSADFRGDPSAALLEVLDPEQNFAFSDHYLDVPYDLSEVMFITTANIRWHIPRPLLDRMETIEIQGYTEEEKVQIAKRFLLPKQIVEHGLLLNQIEVPDRTIRRIIQAYTREAGVRSLERTLASVCRKAARRILRDSSSKVRVNSPILTEFLGPSRYHSQGVIEEAQVGVVMGLAWTEQGGELLPVEVVTMPGKGGFIITGRLGDVMQESARAALSYARSRAEALFIDRAFQESVDLHIHLPEGAIPKDGPSAGVTMFTALVSALTKRPVRNDVVMTGEITLRGRVLAVGGVKEKVLAAHRAGIRRVILPAENRRDLPEIPKKVRDQIQFIWVDNVDQVLQESFLERRGTDHQITEAPPGEPLDQTAPLHEPSGMDEHTVV
ncbi:MAG: endopeptidase La [Chloroflexota bacterium]|nr:MAG: endopeptidase La [Chloroflexota bacterium]